LSKIDVRSGEKGSLLYEIDQLAEDSSELKQ